MNDAIRDLDIHDRQRMLDLLHEVQDGRVSCARAVTEIQGRMGTQQPAEPPDVARNGDRDTLGAMRAVSASMPSGSIQWVDDDGKWHKQFPCLFGFPVHRYRITAKHADTFDPECMDFEAWARAAIGRGMVCKHVCECQHGRPSYYDEIGDGRLRLQGTAAWWGRISECDGIGTHTGCNSSWTAITHAQHAAETAPADSDFGGSYDRHVPDKKCAI